MEVSIGPLNWICQLVPGTGRQMDSVEALRVMKGKNRAWEFLVALTGWGRGWVSKTRKAVKITLMALCT
jgi:hypothetical protein